jgi:hypothetical protein
MDYVADPEIISNFRIQFHKALLTSKDICNDDRRIKPQKKVNPARESSRKLIVPAFKVSDSFVYEESEFNKDVLKVKKKFC